MSFPSSFRMTLQRRILLEEIRGMHSHPTADEVYARVRRRLPKVSLGTIYRNLETLSRAGVIQKLELAGSPRRYDGTTEAHYHVTCLGCGKVEDIRLEPPRNLEEAARQACGFQIVGHTLKFHGLCPKCAGSGPRRKGAPPFDRPGQPRHKEGSEAKTSGKSETGS
jgi:Fur family ferric uptake transcriptional regulator